jgi:hypothetical protein
MDAFRRTASRMLPFEWAVMMALCIASSPASAAVEDGVALCTAANDQQHPTIAADGAGGGIVAWQDARDGSNDIYARRVLAGGGLVAVEPGRVEGFRLHPPRPNPARGEVTIRFELPVAQRVSFEVYDAVGRRVCALAASREWPAGAQSLVWSGADDSGAPLETGLYFVRMSAPGVSAARKLAIMR